MKKFLRALPLSFSLTLIFSFSSAQTGEWTWMKGTPIPFGATGTWGTQGVPDPANDPPSVYEACEWKDKQDNFWIFGGVNNSTQIYYGTLWKYHIGSNMWAWMSGPNIPDQSGVYGTQGVPSPSNYPGARGWGELSWTDSSGNFWLYGGYGYDENGVVGDLGDLWKYDVTTNEWTWMKGSSSAFYTGTYGTQGIPDLLNNPPGRQEAACSWVSSNNDLWMFGGWSPIGQLNDLWKYEIPTNTWTWMKGDNTGNHFGTYGTMGVSSPLNVPGGRAAYTRWIDQQDNLWFYGGNGYGQTGNGFLSDLWKYTAATNEWTWMGGSTIAFQLGVYGPQCDFSSNYYPSNKYEGRTCWVDECGYFFLYGGTSYNGHQGDLWVYNNVSNEWAWLSGDTLTNTSAVPGTQGISSPFNKPGLRTGANSWIDQSGNLWLFGGFVCSNDLWRFVPDYSCIGNELCLQNPQTNFSANETQICEKFCVSFFDSSLNAVSWEWLFPGGNPSSSTDQNPSTICYDNPGTFDVTLITVSSSGDSDTLTLPGYITVYTNPFAPTITQIGNVLTSSPADSYQWYLNTVIIPGATSQSITITQSGLYTVEIADSNGCVAQASIDAGYVGIDLISDESVISIYPNPSNGNFVIAMSAASAWAEHAEQMISIDVINTLGQIVFSHEQKISSSAFKMEIDLKNLTGGIYYIEIKSDDLFARKKLIITK